MLPKCAKVIKSDKMEIKGTARIEPGSGTVQCRPLVSSEASGAAGAAIQGGVSGRREDAGHRD